MLYFITGALITLFVYSYSYYIPYYARKGWLKAERDSRKIRENK